MKAKDLYDLQAEHQEIDGNDLAKLFWLLFADRAPDQERVINISRLRLIERRFIVSRGVEAFLQRAIMLDYQQREGEEIDKEIAELTKTIAQLQREIEDATRYILLMDGPRGEGHVVSVADGELETEGFWQDIEQGGRYTGKLMPAGTTEAEAQVELDAWLLSIDVEVSFPR